MLTPQQQLHLRLRTHHHISVTLSPDHPLILQSLSNLRTLLNQSLDCIDITRWTGDRHSVTFISSQLHLLHSILLEALALLKGPNLLPHPPTPVSTSRPGSSAGGLPILSGGETEKWNDSPPPPESFSPPLPNTLSLHLSLHDTSLLLTIRVLEPTSQEPSLGSRFALAIGAQRRLEHDEMDSTFTYRGEEVRVREKLRVESSTDPSLLSVMAKLGQLERTVEAARLALGIVSGVKIGDDD